MCDFYADGHCDVYQETTVKARFEHKCDSCDGRILPGESYQRVFAVFEGEASSDKQCGACADISERFVKAHHGGPGATWLAEALRECIDPHSRDEEDAEWRRDLAGMLWRGRAGFRARGPVIGMVAALQSFRRVEKGVGE